MPINKVLVIFKTHLDVGYTDFASNVVEKYMKDFIPNSVRTAKELFESGNDARLIWTTGSWLIREYLSTQDTAAVKSLEDGIKNGYICWHGLPFTTHTELMGKVLFEHGLSISQDLDKKYGKKTIAAKMTDVPGHTKAIIPFLKKAGIEFLHIGVNIDSAVPDVPPVFRWKADNGDMINVMYHGDYGEFSEIGDTGVAVHFAHTGDNAGIQSPDEIISIFKDLKEKMPDAEIVAGDLNDIALIVREIEDTLPVISDEIGDSWIHGVGTDPKKVSQFKALERLYESMPECKDKQILADGLMMIPEHTWGLNCQVYLTDHDNYSPADIAELRIHAPNYKKMEESWAEQRNYLYDAVNKLGVEYRSKALACLEECRRDVADMGFIRDFWYDNQINFCGYKMSFNRQGEINYLEKDGVVYADWKHRLLTFIYEMFSYDDYKHYFDRYIRVIHSWTYGDFSKPGMQKAVDCYRRYEPERVHINRVGDDRIVIRYYFPKEAHRLFGAPLMIDAVIKADDEGLKFDIAWFNKPANRAAEALWVGFRPIAHNKKISKLGTPIDPKYVVDNAQSRLHATDFGVVYDELCIESLDAALVAPQEPMLLSFRDCKPADDEGINFNLYNNIWGTNFPMWYDEDARFRFALKIKP